MTGWLSPWLDRWSGWLDAVPLFLVVLVLGLGVSVLVAVALSQRLGMPSWLVFAMGGGLSLIFAATLSPVASGAPGGCLRDVSGPLGPQGLLHYSDRSLNTWLFVPFGVFVGIAVTYQWWIGLLALGSPFFVEAFQRWQPVLNRRCQFQDIVDNMWGLVLGMVAGLLLALLVRALVVASRRQT